MDRMSPLDASFIALENDNNPMHIGNVATFEGPPPRYGDVVRMVADTPTEAGSRQECSVSYLTCERA